MDALSFLYKLSNYLRARYIAKIKKKSLLLNIVGITKVIVIH